MRLGCGPLEERARRGPPRRAHVTPRRHAVDPSAHRRRARGCLVDVMRWGSRSVRLGFADRGHRRGVRRGRSVRRRPGRRRLGRRGRLGGLLGSRRLWRRCRRRRGRGRRGCGRRRGCRGRNGGTARRKQLERVDVGLAVTDPNAEVQVGNCVLGLTAGSRVGDRVALRYRRALADAQCSKVCERGLVAVARSDRHREAVRRHLPRERDLACDRRHNRAGASQRDVDASMLTRGVRVGPDGELAKDRSVRRPRPRPGRRAG
jgi:hypothetical protein